MIVVVDDDTLAGVVRACVLRDRERGLMRWWMRALSDLACDGCSGLVAAWAATPRESR